MEELHPQQQMAQSGGRPKKSVAADIGFNYVKVSFEDGQVAHFPSAVAEPLAAMEGFGGGQKVFMLDAGRFVFGKDALIAGSKPIQELNTNWLLTHMPGLICAAAEQAKVDLHTITEINTGMPLNAWKDHRHEVPKKLKTIRCNGQVFEFDTVNVFPQGVGALAAHAQTGVPPDDETGIALDIGGNTILAVRYDKLKAVGTSTKEYDLGGVLLAARNLTPFLSSLNDGRKVSAIQAMEAIMTKTFRRKDITAQVNEVMAAYCKLILSYFREDFDDLARDLDMLVVAGGGAYYVGEALKKEYPNVTVLENPEFANCRGYAYLASLQG